MILCNIVYVITASKTNERVTKKVFNLIWLLGQAVKTPPFHGGNRGSIPLGVTIYFFCFYVGA